MQGATAEIARLLEANEAFDDRPLFDLTIIDEAHYLRNAGTQNNLLGRLLRDASRHLLLLTATPVQIRSDNLYQLLRLISPEDFFNESAFEEMLEANKPVVRALRALWTLPPNLVLARSALDEALLSPYLANDALLQRVKSSLQSGDVLSPHARIELLRILDNSSLLGHFISRSRKRDVIENRVQRSAQVLQVRFTEAERRVYDYVTRLVREQALGLTGVRFFALIARQTQLSSCMVAAVQAWRNNGPLEEVMAEAFGLGDWSVNGGETGSQGGSARAWELPPELADTSILERVDSKYAAFIGFLKNLTP